MYIKPDNEGREFFIMYLHNFGRQGRTIQPELFMSTSSAQPVTVSVRSPRYSASPVVLDFTITAGNVKQMLLPVEIRGLGSSIESKALHITASAEIMVYGK